MGKLEGKNVLITGGTSGIGAAMAVLFSEEGANVVITGRNITKGELVLKNIKESPAKKKRGDMYFINCDVTDYKSVEQLKGRYLSIYDSLDVLVNNAGVFLSGTLEEMDEEDWVESFNTNTHSVFRVTKLFMDLILSSQGTILNNASIDGLQQLYRGRANYAYAASKAAVVKFTEQMALNYTPMGVRINCICPGVTETPLFTNKDFSRFNKAIPMGRVAQPIEIAKAALFLISEEASYVSGAILAVDGGAALM